MSEIMLDDIARAMTDVEAPADLRARVVAGIAHAESRRSVAILCSLASAASIASILAFAMRPVLVEFQLPAVTHPSLVRLAANDPAPHIVAVSNPAGPTPRTEAISDDELAWLARRLPALETRALTFDPIQPDVPFIAPISVEPIALEPISVPPPGAGSGDRR